MLEIGELLPEPSMDAEIQESRPGYTSCGVLDNLALRIKELQSDEELWRIDTCALLDSFTKGARQAIFENKVQLKSTAWSKAAQNERRQSIALLERALDDFYAKHHARVCAETGENRLLHSFRCSKCKKVYKHHPQRESLFESRRDL